MRLEPSSHDRADPRVDGDGYGADDLASDLGFASSEVADLQAFRALLEAANASMNLVGPSALGSFWRRHALDSAQLLELAPDADSWADLGAGAGFPGLVLAIRLKQRRGAQVHLIESQAKRCRFLQRVIDDLALPASVTWGRAEALPQTPKVDVVCARACAPLRRLFDYALPFIQRDARGLFLKGASAGAEIREAEKSWRFQARLLPSRSDPSGNIVSVERLSRA